jgi:hypothetical protein
LTAGRSSPSITLEAPGKGLQSRIESSSCGGWQISGITRFQSGAPLRLLLPA